MNKTEFSKKLLRLDYAIAFLFVAVLIWCEFQNAQYVKEIQLLLIQSGSFSTITYPYDTAPITAAFQIWIAQLGISSAAYYMMCKSDHKIQLPIKLIKTLPRNIKEKVDMTQLITTVLTSTDN